ncbi:MAG: diguanylate cyclase [Oceanospirillaceae bacterium]|nr:diguanylate cyclase [Oceanospirillaceae bacterium]
MDAVTQSKFDSSQQLELLQFLDVGLVVVNSHLEIKLWNSFMTNHMAIEAVDAIDKTLFDVCPKLPDVYLQRKIKSVITLQNSLTITWQQRPHLFEMNCYRPITSKSKLMYQDIRIIPLLNANAIVDHIAIVIYDVTESARAQIGFQEKNEELKLASRIDPLTKIFNRGYWESRLEAEFKRYTRTSSSSVLIMLDIDHFKAVNDTYGHQGGDTVLRALGRLLKKQYRITDILGRYGGEEFGILLLDTNTEMALTLANNLSKELAKAPIMHDKRAITITLSYGITQIDASFKTHDQWIDMADKALYQSKQNGRNQATILNCQKV